MQPGWLLFISGAILATAATKETAAAITCYDDNQLTGYLRTDCEGCITMVIEDARGNRVIPRCSKSSDCFECKSWTALCHQQYTQCTCKCCTENECNRIADPTQQRLLSGSPPSSQAGDTAKMMALCLILFLVLPQIY